MTTNTKSDETRLAEEIVSALEPSALRDCSSERDVIRFAIRGRALKLRTVTFSRAALRRLLQDAAALVKIDYLKRDLVRMASRRTEYSYPRPATAGKRLDIGVLASRKVGAF